MLQFEMKIILAITTLLGSNKLVSSTGIGDIQTVVNFANDAWGVLNGDLPISALFTGSTGPMLDKIMAGVEEIAGKLDELGDTVVENGRKIDDMTALLEHMLIKLPVQDKVDKSMRKLKSYIERVDFLYENLRLLSAPGNNFTRFTMLLYIDSVISNNPGGLIDILTKMHHLFVPGRSATYKNSLFYLLSEKMKDTGDIECGKSVSSQTRIYEIYKSVEVTEIRAFIMTMASYSLLTVYENASFSGELGLAKNDLIKRSNKYVSTVQLTLETLSRSINLCDIGPYNYELGKTFVKFSTSYNMRNPAGHTFSMRAVKSNYDENMVVTGIRFVEKNGVIFYQIKEAKLLPRGQVNASTERWVPLPEYESREVDGDYSFYHAGTNKLVDSSEIYILTDNIRGFDLDEILLSPDRLLTGLKFRMNDDDAYLKVLTQEFDYETGQLKPDSAEWWSWRSSITRSNRIRDYISIQDLKDPSKVNKPQKIDSFGKEWFQFQVENDEIEANLIPMFDARPVGGKNPSVPLAGLGLFHRGSHESGGIIHFKVYTIDIAAYMKQDSNEE